MASSQAAAAEASPAGQWRRPWERERDGAVAFCPEGDRLLPLRLQGPGAQGGARPGHGEMRPRGSMLEGHWEGLKTPSS